jgi:hypothetical protein
VTGPSPALSLPLEHVRELQQVLTDAAEHLAHGRLSTRVLYDLHYNAARLELALEQGPMSPRDSKEPHR